MNTAFAPTIHACVLVNTTEAVYEHFRAFEGYSGMLQSSNNGSNKSGLIVNKSACCLIQQ